MPRIFIYSDETKGTGSGAPFFVVAGLALDGHHNAIRRELLEAEKVSGKRKSDWHATTEQRRRRQYLTAALKIPSLKERIFFRAVKEPADLWFETVQTLVRAMERFGQDGRVIIAHEGFTRSTREKLKRELAGDSRLEEVRTGDFAGEPLVRLADAVAGFIRVLKFGDPRKADFLRDLDPGWFIELK